MGQLKIRRGRCESRDAVLPRPAPGLPEQRQQNQSQASGAAPGGGEKIKGRKGPLALHLGAGLKNEIILRRP